jgi:hypothetical protein
MTEGQFLGTHTLVGNESNTVEKHYGSRRDAGVTNAKLGAGRIAAAPSGSDLTASLGAALPQGAAVEPVTDRGEAGCIGVEQRG